MNISNRDLQTIIDRYASRYKQFGYSPKTLGWDKGKQLIRFDILLSNFNLLNKSILDIGCGFGDLNIYLQTQYENNYKYLGIDIVPELINEGNKRFIESNIEFLLGDYLNLELEKSYDFIVGSGIFNFKLQELSNYDYIFSVMEKSFLHAEEGIAFNFLSDKVDFTKENTFHSNPGKILEFAYTLSRNVILRNDYMPFEFTVIIFKDDSFDIADTLFRRYKNDENKYY